MKCVWNMNSDCGGEIVEAKMFGQLDIPVCATHLAQHKQVLFLHKHGEDIEKIIELSAEEKEELFQKIRAKYPDEELTA